MKNKKKTYILLVLVLIIWGIVIYKFFSFTRDDIATNAPTNDFLVKPLNIKEKESFSINVNYRDPFLGKIYMPSSVPKATSPKQKLKQAEPIIWPEVIYKGIVSDNKDSKKVFMVIINGQTYLMSEKDIEQEVTLKSGNRESIYVKYKNNLNIILIEE